MSLEVSDAQRALLEENLAALPREAEAEAEARAGGLTRLFYHPNAACRTLALTLSAAFDQAAGRMEPATAKLQRAIRVFRLVAADHADITEQLEEMQQASARGDTAAVLEQMHGRLAPALWKVVDEVAQPPKKPAPVKQPGPVDPAELAVIVAKVRPATAEEDAGEGAEEAVEEAADAVAEVEIEAAEEPPAPEISPEEAAAAAAAALAAIEAPYEEVVEDAPPPRFDPDAVRTARPSSRRRGRQPRGPIGLERPAPPPEEPAVDATAAEAEADEAAPKPEERAERAAGRTEDAEAAQPIAKVVRRGDADLVAAVVLEAAGELIRSLRDANLEGRIAVEITVDRARGGRRRRKRRRRQDEGA